MADMLASSAVEQEELERAITGITEKELDEPADVYVRNYRTVDISTVEVLNMQQVQSEQQEPNRQDDYSSTLHANFGLVEQSMDTFESVQFGKLAASMPLPPTSYPWSKDPSEPIVGGERYMDVSGNQMWSNGMPVMSMPPPYIATVTRGSQQSMMNMPAICSLPYRARGVSSGRGGTARRRRSGSRASRGGVASNHYSFMDSLMDNGNGGFLQTSKYAPPKRLACVSDYLEPVSNSSAAVCPANLAFNESMNRSQQESTDEEGYFATPQLPKRLRSRVCLPDNEEPAGEDADDPLLNDRMDAYIEKFSDSSRGEGVREDQLSGVDLSHRPSNLQEAIAMYIDNLVIENERRTRISECHIAASVPLNFHKEEYYREVMCRPVSFPTRKFRNWLKLYNVDIEITDPEGHTASETMFPPSQAPSGESKVVDDQPPPSPMTTKIPRQLPPTQMPAVRQPPIVRRKRSGQFKGRVGNRGHVPVHPYYVYPQANAEIYSKRSDRMPSDVIHRMNYDSYGLDRHHYAPGTVPFVRGYPIHRGSQSRDGYRCNSHPQQMYHSNYQPLPYPDGSFPGATQNDGYPPYPYQQCMPGMYSGTSHSTSNYPYPTGGGYGYHNTPAMNYPNSDYMMYDPNGGQQPFFQPAESNIEQSNDSNIRGDMALHYSYYNPRPNANIYADVETGMLTGHIKVDLSADDALSSEPMDPRVQNEDEGSWRCNKLDNTGTIAADVDWCQTDGQNLMPSADRGNVTSFTGQVDHRASYAYSSMEYQSCTDENNNIICPANTSYKRRVSDSVERPIVDAVEQPIIGHNVVQPMIGNSLVEQPFLANIYIQQQILDDNINQSIIGNGIDQPILYDNNIRQPIPGNDQNQIINRNQIVDLVLCNQPSEQPILCSNNIDQPILCQHIEQPILHHNNSEQPNLGHNHNTEQPMSDHDIEQPILRNNVVQQITDSNEQPVLAGVQGQIIDGCEHTDLGDGDRSDFGRHEGRPLLGTDKRPTSTSVEESLLAESNRGILDQIEPYDDEIEMNEGYTRDETNTQSDDGYGFCSLDLGSYPPPPSEDCGTRDCETRMNIGDFFTIEPIDDESVSEAYPYEHSIGNGGYDGPPNQPSEAEQNTADVGWQVYNNFDKSDERDEQIKDDTEVNELDDLSASSTQDVLYSSKYDATGVALIGEFITPVTEAVSVASGGMHSCEEAVSCEEDTRMIINEEDEIAPRHQEVFFESCDSKLKDVNVELQNNGVDGMLGDSEALSTVGNQSVEGGNAKWECPEPILIIAPPTMERSTIERVVDHRSELNKDCDDSVPTLTRENQTVATEAYYSSAVGAPVLSTDAAHVTSSTADITPKYFSDATIIVKSDGCSINERGEMNIEKVGDCLDPPDAVYARSELNK